MNQKESSLSFKNIFKRETKLASYIIICLTIVVISLSYAMFFQVDNNSKNQEVVAGELTFTYPNTGNQITSTDKKTCFLPMTEEEASLYAADCSYQFSIRNTGTLNATYTLKILANDDNEMPSSRLKIILKKQQGDTLIPVEGFPKVIGNISDTILITDELEKKENIMYSAQIFADESTLTDTDFNRKVSFRIEGNGLVHEGQRINTVDKGKDIIAQLNTTGSCPTVNEDGTVTVTAKEATNGYVCKAKDDYGDSYYFRGNVTNNYVKFGGFYWRIIRINGDGSIRMIYAGDASVIDALDETTKQTVLANGYNDATTKYSQIGTSAFNESGDYNAYVDYMYGTDIWGEAVKSETTTSKEMNYNFYYDTTYTFDSSTGKYKLTDAATNGAWSADKAGKYTCASHSKTGICTTLYKITSYTDNLYGQAYLYTSSGSSGAYTENHGTTLKIIRVGTKYYYGTGYESNKDDGTFQLTNYSSEPWDASKVGKYTCASTNTSCSTLYYVESYDDAVSGTVSSFASWKGTTYEKTHKNEKDSTIKTKVDAWYQTHLAGTEYEKYISDTLFCNDRSISPYKPDDSYLNTGIGKDKTMYRWYYVPKKNYPILRCKKQNDRFTSDDTTLGNGALTYPIGLITKDEVFLGGGYNVNVSNSGYYLYTGNAYWTMSPTSFDGNYAKVSIMNHEGKVHYISKVTSMFGVRPVLNLKAGSLNSGTGVWNDPYLVGSD